MDSSPSPENPAAAPKPSRRRIFGLCIVIAALLAITLTLIFAFLTAAQPRFAFLTQDQFFQAKKPGPFTRLKIKLLNLAGPVLRPFRKKSSGILVSSSILTRPVDAPMPGQLGAPFTTNDTGMEAWILSPGETASVLPELKRKSYSSSVSNVRIQTSSGIPASLHTGTSVQLASGRWIFLGNILDLTAITTASSVNLVFDASSTDPDNTTGNQLAVKTNFYVACRALIPNSGSILINCGHTDPTNNANYWLLLTPQLLDASGKPIRAR
jgi:hypothetical protein